MDMPMKLMIGDEVELKKVHPCGSKVFTIRRTGADFRLECRGCNNQIWLSRRDLERRIQKINGEKKSHWMEKQRTLSSSSNKS